MSRLTFLTLRDPLLGHHGWPKTGLERAENNFHELLLTESGVIHPSRQTDTLKSS
jgi:hypothetical protein